MKARSYSPPTTWFLGARFCSGGVPRAVFAFGFVASSTGAKPKSSNAEVRMRLGIATTAAAANLTSHPRTALTYNPGAEESWRHAGSAS
mmetsp:Transcript_38282/g.102087  ORF Transcript_38282/g.102087 Transcript_38282/m.102087 type:complete len:89 (+) Transcript_38282:265-531(+)